MGQRRAYPAGEIFCSRHIPSFLQGHIHNQSQSGPLPTKLNSQLGM